MNPHVSMPFDNLRHYPKWLEKQDRKSGHVDEVSPISVTFTLTATEMASINDRFGDGVLPSGSATFFRRYDNSLSADLVVNELATVKRIILDVTDEALKAAVESLETIDDLRRKLSDLVDPEVLDATSRLKAAIESLVGSQCLADAIKDYSHNTLKCSKGSF